MQHVDDRRSGCNRNSSIATRKTGQAQRPTPRCPSTNRWATWRARNCVSALPPGPTFATATTAIACGSVNCAHDSLNPLAGLSPLTGMWLNCIYGGKGVGMINLLLYLIVGVFIAGLMVGRTPEYLGKKVEAREMKLAMLALLVHPIMILMPAGLFAATDWGMKSDQQPRRARPVGNGLRVQFRLGQQRLGVRGHRTPPGASTTMPQPGPVTAGRGTSPRAW